MLQLNEILMLSSGMFVLGLIGFLTRKNMILMFLAVELMLAAVAINFVAFGSRLGLQQGQLFAVLILTVASCEAAIGLALVVAMYKRKSTLDISQWDSLHEVEPPKLAESGEIEDDNIHDYPTLAPAGLAPNAQSTVKGGSRAANEKA